MSNPATPDQPSPGPAKDDEQELIDHLTKPLRTSRGFTPSGALEIVHLAGEMARVLAENLPDRSRLGSVLRQLVAVRDSAVSGIVALVGDDEPVSSSPPPTYPPPGPANPRRHPQQDPLEPHQTSPTEIEAATPPEPTAEAGGRPRWSGEPDQG